MTTGTTAPAESRFTEIRRAPVRLADEVYQQILSALHRGDIGPDERIVQERLADELNISRTPVREALLRLEQDGILETAGRGGFRLRTISDTEVREIYQARGAVEVQAARILTVENNPAKAAIIRSVIESAERIDEKTARAYFNANRTIHRTIVMQAGNRFLIEMFDNIWNRGFSFHLFSAIGAIDFSKSLGGHAALVDVIESGDVTAATDAFIAHIDDGLQLQIDALHNGKRG